MAQNPMNKWRVDLGGGAAARSLVRNSDPSLNPPGFNSCIGSSHQTRKLSRDEQQHQRLLSKRAWEMALGPVKSLPMNFFMMYMAGNTISIFPIMMVAMMAWRPAKALMATNAAFRSLEIECGRPLFFHKILFVLGNLCVVGLAVYKCHSMGLLPTHASDWLDFQHPPERLQYVLAGDYS